MKKKRKIWSIIYHIIVCGIGFIMIYPLLWMFISSFKHTNQIFLTADQLIPVEPTLENYINGWKGFAGISFSVFFRNSGFITIIATLGAVLSSAVVAYGFARCRFKTRKILFTCMLLSMMLPFQIIMIPQYIWFKRLNWIDTYLPLIVPFYFGQAFFIFMIMQFVQGIPRELDEAAKIDGCSIYGIFVRIIMPLITPALITSMIFSFIWRWDDFLAPLLYLSKPSAYPVSIALKLFSDPSSSSDYGAMFAMSSLSVLPAILIFIFFQKYLMEGVSHSGLKG